MSGPKTVIPDHPFGVWIPASDSLPDGLRHVLAHYLNKLGKPRIIRAFYAHQHTIEDNSDNDFGDGNEDHEGTTYIVAGWYEENENDEHFWFVSDAVTDWMEMPAYPSPAREEGP